MGDHISILNIRGKSHNNNLSGAEQTVHWYFVSTFNQFLLEFIRNFSLILTLKEFKDKLRSASGIFELRTESLEERRLFPTWYLFALIALKNN